MNCTYQDIERMFEIGRGTDCTHMVVVRDDFDYSCYAVYTNTPEVAVAEARGQSMTRVMEVYDLREEFEFQHEHRSLEGMVWNMPGMFVT